MHVAPSALSSSPLPQCHRLTWKRRALKEICAFLLLCNILVSSLLNTHHLARWFKALHHSSSCATRDLGLCPCSLWIMPAFGARPQFDNTIGAEFYEFTMWAAVVNIGLPFGIFYRMHSVASLFEVFLTS
ncbi:unnamed protein product [Oncorhynchus mykiss]|uniref:Uncharacterized protein n=1 Tax=Oncorhynchus mykiss TaxID=8022 RepID=A0A060YWR3_ONCMY|nr:unnamed protein product [Oncorhynchus mykiss]